MKKYTFLLKPLFFIFNLLFASWLVVKIEKISPSDLGKHKSLFTKDVKPLVITNSNTQHLKKLYSDYTSGKIDSLVFDREFRKSIDSTEK